MPRLFTFSAGATGSWRIESLRAVIGEGLPQAARLAVIEGEPTDPDAAAWTLRGMVSNERYTTRPEKEALVAAQAALGRPEARCGAFIPIRKSAAWWALTQDERRAIFEDGSQHVQTGMRYLPGIARRLHHCRDLGEHEPFDFLTFFDYAPGDAAAFEDLVGALRATPEWRYVEREVDVRLMRDP